MNKSWVVCVDNRDYPASLELGKFYPVKQDLKAQQRGFLRVVDESGEDYLYPKGLFNFTGKTPVIQSQRLTAVVA
jgi:hypothetical protein